MKKTWIINLLSILEEHTSAYADNLKQDEVIVLCSVRTAFLQETMTTSYLLVFQKLQHKDSGNTKFEILTTCILHHPRSEKSCLRNCYTGFLFQHNLIVLQKILQN